MFVIKPKAPPTAPPPVQSKMDALRPQRLDCSLKAEQPTTQKEARHEKQQTKQRVASMDDDEEGCGRGRSDASLWGRDRGERKAL